MKLDYRKEIEGLRALAVIGVVAFHIGLTRIGGGFVGVDIFFVISGFLISRIILNEMANGEFSLAGFYSRRARRILPVLLAVVAVVYVAALFLLIPSDLVALSKSTIATVLFVSNHFFLSQTGYFQPDAQDVPLLHTWSIGVEEQFYLVFPLLLWLLFRYARRALPAVIVTGMVALFALSAWGVTAYPAAAFYLIPFRAWELLLGASLAVLTLPTCGRLLGNVLLMAGLALIVFACCYFDRTTPTPGLPALIPCLGAWLVIYAGPSARSGAGRLLTNPVVAGIGRISYSMYLWHWPPVVFIQQNIKPIASLSWLEVGLYFAVLIAVSAVSYAVIESPFRDPRVIAPKRAMAAAAGLAAVLLIAAGAAVSTKGFPARLSKEKQLIARYSDYESSVDPVTSRCHAALTTDLSQFPLSSCVARDASKPTIMFWGDSVMQFEMPGLRAAALAQGFAVAQATMSACRPIADADFDKTCTAFVSMVRDRIVQQKPGLVVMSARWNIEDPNTKATGRPVYERALALAADIAREGTAVVLLGPPVQYGVALPRLLLKTKGDDFEAFDATRYVMASAGEVDRRMRAAAEKLPGIAYISVMDALCPGGRCKVVTKGVPMSFDVHHMTQPGSLYLAERIFPDIAERVQRGPAAVGR